MRYYIKIALQHYAMGLVIPVAIVWKLQNGLTVPQAVLTESLVLLVTALTDLPAGFIANTIGNKRSLLIGGLLHTIGMALLAIGSSLAVFTLAAVATGMAWAFISGADEAYIHDDFIEQKDEYKKVFATANIVDESATIVGMLSASLFVYLHTGVRALLVFSLVMLAIHFVYTWFFLPRSQTLPSIHPSRAISLFTGQLLRSREVLIIIPLMITFAVVYEALRPLWQPHMQQLGINIADFGLIFAVLKTASLSGSVLARHREFHARDISFIFVVMLTALLSFGSSAKYFSLFALCVYLFSENYFRVYLSTVLNKLIVSNRAAVLSFGSVIRNATGALIVAGAGLVSGHSIFLAFLLLVLIKIPAIVYIVRTHIKAFASNSTSSTTAGS